MWARALAYGKFGGPEVLELIKVWTPEPGPGQVRVTVRTGGLNPIDGKLRAGVFSGGLPVLTPARLGSEFAGVVESVGEGVDEFAAGDEVIGIVPERSGHAEALISPAEFLAPRPQSVSWAASSAISAGGMTAYGALGEIDIQTGDTVIIHGASGAVGTIAVQLARLWGADTVIGTASAENHDYLRSIGAVPVSYGPGLRERLSAVVPEGRPVKMLDAAGREAVADSIGFVTNPATDVISLLPFVDEEFGVKFNILRYDGDVLRAVAALVADGSIAVREPTVFGFDEPAKAHELLDTGHTHGKVVYEIG